VLAAPVGRSREKCFKLPIRWTFTLNNPPLTLIVTATGSSAPLLPLTSSRIFDASVGSSFSCTLDVLLRGGTPPFTWAVASGAVLPPGLSLVVGSNGVPNHLAGVATTAAPSFYSVVVSDAGQTLTIPFTQNVSAVALAPDLLPAGTVGVPDSVSLVPSGGTAPYTIQFSATSDLPPGLVWGASGALSGTPRTAGDFPFVVLVAHSSGKFLTRTYRGTIDNAVAAEAATAEGP
jgi:hypothetical protein